MKPAFLKLQSIVTLLLAFHWLKGNTWRAIKQAEGYDYSYRAHYEMDNKSGNITCVPKTIRDLCCREVAV